MSVSSTDSDDEEDNLPLSAIGNRFKKKQLSCSSVIDITRIKKNTFNKRIKKANPPTSTRSTIKKGTKGQNTQIGNDSNYRQNTENVPFIGNTALQELQLESESDNQSIFLIQEGSFRKKSRERREKWYKKYGNINNNKIQIEPRKFFFKSAENIHAIKVATSTEITTGTDEEGLKRVTPSVVSFLRIPSASSSRKRSLSSSQKINKRKTDNCCKRILKPINEADQVTPIVPTIEEGSRQIINNYETHSLETFDSFARNCNYKPNLNRQKLSLIAGKQQKAILKKRKYPSTSTPFITRRVDTVENSFQEKENFPQSSGSTDNIISKKHKLNNNSKEFADIFAAFPKSIDKNFLVEKKCNTTPKSNKLYKLSLSSKAGALKNFKNINSTANGFPLSKHSKAYNKNIADKLVEINNNNNNNKTLLEVKEVDQKLVNSGQKETTEIMSLYDYRVQSDDRPVGNCFVARGSHSSSGNNDENNGTLVNQYYQYSQPSIATLCNIGNTCYLNSVVYTLRFAPLFLHNLHHLVEDLSNVHNRIVKNRAKSSSLGRNVSGLHMENPRSWSSKDLASLENSSSDVPKSNQQIATEKLHELYQNLHRNELLDSTDPFHADTFLHAIQEVSAIFEGNQQQDAHEFLMCVLDSIRETCQALIKAITDCPEVINNVCLSLPEHAEPAAAIKDQPPPRETSTSSAASIKTKFFSRKSKRKDDTKNAKNVRIHSPHKDNTTIISPDMVDGTTNSKNSLSSSSTTDDDVSVNDKEKLSEKIKKLGLDFFSEDFEGITVSTTKCLSCETITEQKETMIDIAVPASGYKNSGGNNGSNKVDEFFIQNSCVTREYFCGDNKYRCEQCIGYTEAIRSISYEVLPRLLIIQLNRFSGGMEKINTYLPTPFILECFCAKCCELKKKDKLHVYKLYSVITHVGATMSVGHYIAYTCSLDCATEYINCQKDRRRQTNLNSSTTSSTGSSNNSSGIGSAGSGNTSNTTQEKNVGLVKKIIFGRSKASSSGDVTKNVKNNINGISNKTSLTNGIDKLNINTTCPSVNCCGIKLKTNHHGTSNNHHLTTNPYSNTNGVCSDISENQSSGFDSTNFTNSSLSSSSNNKTNKITPPGKQTWYMCDDDKIKAMSQSEFEDLLSPERKIMITPYLLFYARSDLQ